MMRNICHILAIYHYLIIRVSSYYEEPAYDKYPFVVSIVGPKEGHICSGSLVNLKWVLTNAHCVDTYKDTPDCIHVSAGEPKSPDEQMRMVEKIYSHNNFDKESFFDDIALLLLDQQFLRRKTVDVIYVPKYPMHIEMRTRCKSVLLLGFELEEMQDKKTGKPLVRTALITFEHEVLSDEQCAKRRKFKVMKHTFCGYAKNMTACMRDTGGPAICDGLVYGLIYYGCPWDESPSYFTRVDRYLIFIETIMGKDAPYITAKRSTGTKLKLEIYSFGWMIFIFSLM